ncbi:hypothetical protein OHD62_33815 [Mesorhizobium sp. YC-39]|uniref:hypothetical protein n=1 Tax=unclassified Mesorhizobium TaxID=325217 RepID=UPI0021E7EB09|nr:MULTISPECIES: hypothetical protein [unclassified Mesorhizobium]MCV3211613.1 hypothetical protein [Mesorhizobium sp. YC-2]MCV3233338.1 hypothetical protein [Mesorhizobium sp. YC-39]
MGDEGNRDNANTSGYGPNAACRAEASLFLDLTPTREAVVLSALRTPGLLPGRWSARNELSRAGRNPKSTLETCGDVLSDALAKWREELRETRVRRDLSATWHQDSDAEG